jgi:hypothetical protein
MLFNQSKNTGEMSTLNTISMKRLPSLKHNPKKPKRRQRRPLRLSLPTSSNNLRPSSRQKLPTPKSRLREKNATRKHG